MGTLERRETLTHRLGSAGRISIKTVTGKIRVRGVEGEDVRVAVTYRIRATDHASAERALESGRIIVDRGPDFMEVETPERRLSTGLAWLFGGARVSADFDVEVPWGARVRFETMSGSVEAINLIGDQKYRTVSGEIRLWNLGGLVEAGTISGSIVLDGGTALRLRANTISGSIKARAGMFHSLTLSTTSGGMTVTGALDPSGDHRAESISGGVDLTPMSGVTAELKTVSGSVHSEIESRVDGSRGFWRTTVGDGAAILRVNSTSGSLRLLAARPAAQTQWPAPPTQWPPAASATPAAPATRAAAATPAAASTPQGSPVAGTEPKAGRPADPMAVEAPVAPAAEPIDDQSAETWNPEETAEEAAEHERDDHADAEELAVLRALERGEIGVDEAAARLERTGGGGSVG